MEKFTKLSSICCLIALSFLLFNGCATIFKGGTETVGFSSDPLGAKVYVNGQYMGVGPLQLQLKSNQTYTIEFRKEGFQPKTVILNNSIGAGWIILDVLFGFIPVVIDAATGNWFSLDQTHVAAALESQQGK